MLSLILTASLFSQVIAAEGTLAITPKMFTHQAECQALPLGETMTFRATAFWEPSSGFYEIGNAIFESGGYYEPKPIDYHDEYGWQSPVPRDDQSHFEVVSFNPNGGPGQLLLVPFDGPPELIGCQYDLELIEYAETIPGDATRDGLFDSGDMIAVFQAGQYETLSEATWAEGDWNADGLFTSGDLVTALQTGLYEKQPGPSVPEPSCLQLATLAMLLVLRRSPSRLGQASKRLR
jgi:hypothetical protein